MKVLCIGAFGNGNVGDMYQADAIAAALREADPTVEVSSLSPSKRGSEYPAAMHTIVAPDRLYDPEVLNSFDLILVGGGGLLASPHHPLPDKDWVNLIDTPMCALSVGVAAKHAAESAAFVAKCALFSVRDEYSHRAIASMRPDADIVMDPILLAPDDFHPMGEYKPRSGIVWVPGKLVTETANFYAHLRDTIFDPRDDHIISFNELTDRGSGFDEVFGDHVEYISSIEEFHAVCRKSRFVVSERYHGCILALRAGAPCLGVALRSEIVTSKITELYRRLGAENLIMRRDDRWARSHLRDRSAAQNPEMIASYLAEQRTGYRRFLERCLSLGKGG